MVQPDSKYKISTYKSNYKRNSYKIRPDQPKKIIKSCELTKSGHMKIYEPSMNVFFSLQTMRSNELAGQ